MTSCSLTLPAPRGFHPRRQAHVCALAAAALHHCRRVFGLRASAAPGAPRGASFLRASDLRRETQIAGREVAV